MTRRELREKVFQLLFQAEFQDPYEMPVDPEELMNASDSAEVLDKLKSILDRRDTEDLVINRCARGWKTTRMSKVDLSILRLAVYEILFDESIPESVSANEAVELAKIYSSDEASAFVNGVLSAVISQKDELKAEYNNTCVADAYPVSGTPENEA